MKKNQVAQKNCFVFKNIHRTSRMQLSRPCGTFPPIFRHTFLIGDQNLKKKLLHFSTEMQIFHQIFVCKAKLLLWQLCRNISSESGELSNSNHGNDEKNLQFEKNIQMVLWRRELQFCQHCKKKSATFKLLSALSPKMWKAIIFFKNFVLSPKRSSVQVEFSSDSRTETFLPNTWFISCLKTKIDRKTITFFSNNPIFYQMVVCTRKKWFWQLRQKILALKLWKFWKKNVDSHFFPL